MRDNLKQLKRKITTGAEYRIKGINISKVHNSADYSDDFSIISMKGGGLKVVVTDIRIRKVAGEGKMKAVASVTFDNEFVVHDIKLIEGLNGMFIAMPSRKTPRGEYKDIAHPISSDMRGRLQTLVIDEYNRMAIE